MTGEGTRHQALVEAMLEATKVREGTPMVTKQVDKFEDGHLELLQSQKSFWGKIFPIHEK